MSVPSSQTPKKFSWKVMLFAFPLIAVAQVLATLTVHGPLGASISALATFAAGYLGLHTQAPAFLVSRPKVSSLIALVKAGLAVKLGLLLPFIPDPRLQVGLWLVIALLVYLAGVPLTVGSSGAALPVPVDSPQGFGDLRALGALSIASLAALGGISWCCGAHGLGLVLLIVAILLVGANALGLMIIGGGSSSSRRSKSST